MEFSRYCHFRYARAAAEWDFCSEILNFGFRSTWATPQPRRHPVAARNRKRRLHPASTPSLMRFWLADVEILRFFVQKFCSEISNFWTKFLICTRFSKNNSVSVPNVKKGCVYKKEETHGFSTVPVPVSNSVRQRRTMVLKITLFFQMLPFVGIAAPNPKREWAIVEEICNEKSSK